MESNQKQPMEVKTPEKRAWKWKVYLILALIILGAVAYGYWWVQQTNTLRTEAKQVIEQAEKYDVLQSAIKNERRRCENFIAQKEGSFGSFEYCKELIDWSETLPLTK